jgi:PTS system glucitol/sorbitol-specific IIA component
MELVYRTTIIEIGEKVMEFIPQGMIVIFKDNAPDYLREYCVIHKENMLLKEIQKNDILRIGNLEFKIESVGSAVNENLKNLGHITLRFDGGVNSLPGSLNLEKKSMPEIKNNMKIEIWR